MKQPYATIRLNFKLGSIFLHYGLVGYEWMKMARLELATLGTLAFRLGGEPVAGLKTEKVRALLVYLAVENDRPHRRQSLAGLLWTDFPERKARTNLRHALANLRKALGEDQNDPPFLLVERETIVTGDEIDALFGLLFLVGVDIWAGEQSIGDLGRHTGVRAKEGPNVVSKTTIPLFPIVADEAAHLV